MNAEVLPWDSLRQRLVQAGHRPPTSSEVGYDSVDLSSGPDWSDVVNVAMHADPVLRKQYRVNYYLWPTAEPPANHRDAFIAGPVDWIVSRFPDEAKCLAWTTPQAWVDCEFFRSEAGGEFEPVIRTLLMHGAIVISPAGMTKGNLISSLAYFVWESDCNVYVASQELREVYVIHHHARIALFNPRASERREACEWLRVNCLDISGYEFDDDDDW